MQIGIGLPANIPGVRPELLREWAQRVDAGPFSSLNVIDRLVFPNYDPLIALTAAAVVTQRARLMTTILIAPLREGGILAKQAATLDVVSHGRLTLGLAVGTREDDYRVAPADFATRGQRFDEQLALMRRIWSGEAPEPGIKPVGPAPVQRGGPEVLIGGYSPAALRRRVGRWGDGYTSGGGPPAPSAAAFRAAEEGWKEAGRAGKPRFVGGVYFGLGPNAAEKAGAYIRDYYGFIGPSVEEVIQVQTTPEALRQTIRAWQDVGADEMVAYPCIAETDQLDRLLEVMSTVP